MKKKKKKKKKRGKILEQLHQIHGGEKDTRGQPNPKINWPKQQNVHAIFTKLLNQQRLAEMPFRETHIKNSILACLENTKNNKVRPSKAESKKAPQKEDNTLDSTLLKISNQLDLLC